MALHQKPIHGCAAHQHLFAFDPLRAFFRRDSWVYSSFLPARSGVRRYPCPTANHGDGWLCQAVLSGKYVALFALLNTLDYFHVSGWNAVHSIFLFRAESKVQRIHLWLLHRAVLRPVVCALGAPNFDSGLRGNQVPPQLFLDFNRGL